MQIIPAYICLITPPPQNKQSSEYEIKKGFTDSFSRYPVLMHPHIAGTSLCTKKRIFAVFSLYSFAFCGTRSCDNYLKRFQLTENNAVRRIMKSKVGVVALVSEIHVYAGISQEHARSSKCTLLLTQHAAPFGLPQGGHYCIVEHTCMLVGS